MKPLHIAIIIAAVLPLAYFVAPTETKDALKESIARLSNDPGQICLDRVRSSLKDPMSAKLYNTEFPSDCVYKDSKCVQIKYHAKNSYGAYKPLSKVCVISNKNDIKEDELNTLSYELHQATLIQIERLTDEAAAYNMAARENVSYEEAHVKVLARKQKGISP